MSERKHIYEAGTKCWCGQSAPPAPPAAPDLADYQEWWSRQIPNNYKHESAVAIAYAQSKLASAESELEDKTAHIERLCADLRELQSELVQLKAERDRMREALTELFGATKNDLVAKGLPVEWKNDSPMGRAEAALSEKGSKE